MNKNFSTYYINLDALSQSQLEHAKRAVNEATGGSCSNGVLVRYGLDLVSKDLDRQLNNPVGLAERLKRKVGKYRWARAANSNHKRKSNYVPRTKTN